jgi:hypothetical protein
MPSAQIGDTGIFLVKLRTYGAASAVAIPRKVAEATGLTNGFFVGVLAVGPCAVLVKIQQGTTAAIEEEIRVAFEAAIREWRKSHEVVSVEAL